MKKISLLTNLLCLAICTSNSQAQADVYYPDPCYANECESFYNGTFKVGADYLYWKAEQENLSIGSDTTINGTSATQHTLNPKFNYKSGFKVNVGYELPGNEWGANVEYTHFKANAHVSSTPANPGLTRFIEASDAIVGMAAFANIKSSWDLHFNQVDVDFTRNIVLGESFTLRPHMGFRTIWWDQTQTFSGFGASDDLLPVFGNVDARRKEKLDGYGLEGGLWADWNIGYGVSLVGHVGGSVLYSKFKTSYAGDFSSDSTGSLISELNRRNTIHTGTPTVDYFAGLQYADCLFDLLVAARLGWEHHVILNANQFEGSEGNLSAAGLTAGLDVSF